MDAVRISQKALRFLQKYRIVVLVFLLGIVLMNLPSQSDIAQSDISVESPKATNTPEITLSEELEETLGQIAGVGRVRVMLSLRSGEEIIYQTDVQSSSSDTSSTESSHTVIITGDDRGQLGVITQVNPASYMGAIVVCQGGDDPTVRYNVVEAVSNITGLGADRISVLKMK